MRGATIGVPTAMLTYAARPRATNISASELPYTWYKALVVAGAKEHRLPEAYIQILEAAPAKADTIAERAAKNFAIAND